MMTCEVGRLQRERQMLEQQIADLFAFFSKQRAEMVRHFHKESEEMLNVTQEAMQRGRAQQNIQPPPAQHARSNSRARPLPVPGT